MTAKWAQMLAVSLLLLGSASAPSMAREVVLWQIGTPDGRSQEFALAGHPNDIPKQFSSRPEIVYDINKSDPSRDWPATHPGPQDSWADGKTLKRTIHFNLPQAPGGRVWLRLDFVDTCRETAPGFQITLNHQSARFEPVCGTGAGLSDDTKGKAQRVELELPASLLHQGENELVLSADQGWSLYDALTLLQDAQGSAPEFRIVNFSLKPTSLFVRRDGKLLRVVDATLSLSGAIGNAAFHIESPAGSPEIAPEKLPAFGALERELLIPDADTATDVQVTATVGRKKRSATVRIEPCRKWKIYVAASAHTDIGYTHLQPEVAERHNLNTDKAMERIKQYPEFK
ncbi:MAG TPA: polysaccharide lyase family protein [Armatimonadota bacterium]|jgi:hypothetical protein